MPVEQRYAEAFLERADLPADRGLAQVERLAGMGEAARLGDRVKNPQLVPVHRHLLAFREPPSPRSPYSAARAAAVSSSAPRNFSASSAAMQPSPAAVTAWRNTLSLTSPAANSPSTAVAVESGSVRM